MKKLMALLLALALSFGLCACGSGSETSKTEQSGSSDGPVEIVWWTNYGASNVGYIQTRIDAFNASQTKYHVSIERQGGASELKAKLSSTEKQNLPAMFSGTPSTTSYYVNSKFTVPIQQFIDADTENWTENLYTPIRSSYCDVDGKMYGYPFGVSCTGLWVNLDLIEKAGYQLTDLTSFAKVAEAAGAVVKGGYANNGVAFFKDGSFLNDMLTLQGVDIVDNGNGRTGDAGKCLYTEGKTNAALTTAMQTFAGLYQNKAAYAFGSDVNGEIIPLFASGDLGMFYATNSYAGKLLATGTKVNYAFIPSVGVDGSAAYSGVLPAGTGNYIADNGDANKQQGAYEFIKFLAKDENQAYWCEQTGYIPYTSTCADSEEYQNWMKTNFASAGNVTAKMLTTDASLKGPYVSAANEMASANVLLMERVATDPATNIGAALKEASDTVTEALEIAALAK